MTQGGMNARKNHHFYINFRLVLVWFCVWLLLRLALQVSAQCPGDDGSNNMEETPSVICQYDVIIIRQDLNCSIAVRERMVFPYATGDCLTRLIWVGTLQTIDQPKVLVDGKPWKAELYSNVTGKTCGHGIVCVKAPRSTNPVTVEIVYSLKDAAMKFTKTCPINQGRAIGNSNVIRWTSGYRNTTTDYRSVNVRVVSLIENAEMAVVDGNPLQWNKTVTTSLQNQRGEFELLIAERNVEQCKFDMWCIRRQFVDDTSRHTPIFITIFTICVAIVITLIMMCVCAPCCARSRTQKRNVEHQD